MGYQRRVHGVVCDSDGDVEVRVRLDLDDYPWEAGFVVYGSDGNSEIFNYGTWNNPGVHEVLVSLPPGLSEIILYDRYGDGYCCDYWDDGRSGDVEVYYGSNLL